VPRLDLIARAEAHYLGQPPRMRWTKLAGIGLLACTAAILVCGREPAHTRVAIRVDCSDPRACEIAESLALDVWSEHRGPGLPLDVVVRDDVLRRLEAARVSWQVLVPDIDAAARAEAARLRSATAMQPADWFADYRDYRAISERLRELAVLAPDRVSLQGIGSSLDGRTIWAVRIGKQGGTPMLINGTLHAREWIAAMVSTCVADRLVREYDTDPAIRAFVDRTELWVVPVVNPDGYQYSWSTDRYWRKNRRERHGVDLNRNFSVAWGGSGSSGNKNAQNYRGASAFSEPESVAIRDLAKRERIALHVDFHSYGQLLLYPWDYSARPTKDHARYGAVGDAMASAMFAPHQQRYRLMQGVELYPSAGTISDWAYGDVDALSYTIELRPKMGRGGFVLPPDQIRPTCDEGLAAVLALGASAVQ
jgi:carboxypeptidase T